MDYGSQSGTIKNQLSGVNSSVNNINGIDFDSIWNGEVHERLMTVLNDAIKDVNTTKENVEKYTEVLELLQQYKEICEKIIELEAELACIPEYKAGVFGVKDAINSIKRAALEAKINELKNKKVSLRSSIESLMGSFTFTNTEISEVSYTDLPFLNIKPKNNSDISHRGYTPGNIYDNSAEGFILAGENGFWGCEADVRFDSNGNLVCSHNAVEIDQNPTTFEEYLDICKEYGMTAIIDLKYEKGVGPFDSDLSPAILKTIQDKGMMDSCVLQTNNYTDVPYIRETSENARIWYLTDVISDSNLKLIEENNVECVNILSSDNNAYKIAELTENGIDVCVWNVQTEETKEKVLNLGAKYVMSDNVLGITPYQEGEYDFNGVVS